MARQKKYVWRVILAMIVFFLNVGVVFGQDDWTVVMAQIPLASPVSFSVMPNGTYGFGVATQWQAMHTGIDYMGPEDSPVYATRGGVVKWASWWPASMEASGNGHGPTVWVQHEVQGVKFCTLAAHLKNILVTPGQQVEAGMQIGVIGPMPGSGAGIGTHTHFAVWGVGECDPSLGNNIGGTWFDPLPMIALGTSGFAPEQVQEIPEAKNPIVVAPGEYWRFDNLTEGVTGEKSSTQVGEVSEKNPSIQITTRWGSVEITLPPAPVLVILGILLAVLLFVAALWEH